MVTVIICMDRVIVERVRYFGPIICISTTATMVTVAIVMGMTINRRVQNICPVIHIGVAGVASYHCNMYFVVPSRLWYSYHYITYSKYVLYKVCTGRVFVQMIFLAFKIRAV